MILRLATLVLCAAAFWSVEAAVANSKCGACMMIVSELETGIDAEDAKKTKIQVGSFRVDPKGNQKGLNEIPYARSETHILELLETVCDKAKNYVTAAHPATGKTVFLKKTTADLLHLKSDSSKSSKLGNACTDFLDDHEDDLVKFLNSEHASPVRAFCHSEISVCTSVDVTEFPTEAPEPEEPEEEENDEL